jgi:hypothetical protein
MQIRFISLAGGIIMNKAGRDKLALTMRYLARIISTLLAAFLLLFAVGGWIQSMSRGDEMVLDYEHIKMTIYFVMIAVGTILGWWRDILGGMILAFVGLVFSVTVFIEMESHDYWIVLIFGLPFLVCGVLFLLSWRRQKKLQAQ